MSNDQITEKGIIFPEEAAYLSEISQKLDEALEKARDDVRRIDREYRDEKRYMAENRGEIDPHEMFQNELLLKQTDQTGAFAVDIRDRLARLRESPYFGRIDFKGGDSAAPARIYIGPSAFNYGNEPLIFDWRAPVASMFYDYEVGPAGYDAPMGRIEGELTRKRQFKIRNGVMEYALESSAHVQDDILQRELSHTSDEKMKSIISTIQKEQNQIIRREKTGTIIIQGVAGSGKTSIALHRIAFLLYRFRNQLSARNVTILSPNKVFGSYISNVIPELGEEPVYEMGFLDIAEIQLEKVINFEPDKDPLEMEDGKWMERVRFKSTLDFVGQMDAYISGMEDWIFVPEDYCFGGFTADARWIRDRFHAYGKYPVRQRISMTAEDIHNRFKNENIWEDELPGPGRIAKSLASMLAVKSTLALYKNFYQSIGKPHLFVMPARKTLEWSDVFPFLYLHAAFEGVKESVITKHLVIDEMQDYTPIQYAVMNRLFPCQKTILGDCGQNLNPYHPHTLEDILRIYEGADYVELNRSYRSTFEIMNFAKHIRDVAGLDAVERHGEEPSMVACEDEQDEIRQIKQAILEFEAGENASLGIILKNNRAAREFHDLLSCGPTSGGDRIKLISPDSTHYEGGVSVTSIQMAKGLEFDEVIVPQADRGTYSDDYDRSLLYIACTRAMHRLTLFYVGEVSGLLI
ncbi:HelD family protein [Enterocloster hominis (ex Hitch et al. 2024)]|uniref:HelD family protein n=1 Tax=Enterocloster hominis (ex Hitch et al. 2024) TaxID=1917870 RepID=UPI002F4176B2